MKSLALAITLVVVFQSIGTTVAVRVQFPEGKNGGPSCLACTAVVALLEQLVEFKNRTVVDTVEGICELFPPKVYLPCKEAIEYLGPPLIKLIIHGNGPSVACHALNFCYTEKGYPACTLSPPPWDKSKLPFKMKVAKAKSLIHQHLKNAPNAFNICDIPGIKFICEWVNRSMSEAKPLIDFDMDGFSPLREIRGTVWRGKDCSDIFSRVHPGALPTDHDLFFDTNCNGIYGFDKNTKKSFEDEFCGQSQPRGVATLGDSISAHFSFPPVWLDATRISAESFKNLPLIVEDEFDWPMLGSFTGYGTNNWTEVIQGPIDSIYKRMVERNRCNHRDYQNIAINGEDSFNVHNVMKSLSRNQKLDRPLMLFIVLIGNDVCQGKSGSIDNMTTPKQMYDNTLITLQYLDKHIPAGSSVTILGLADGRVLYDSMANRIHPVGNYWHQYPYSEFYDFLTCLHLSPCPAWLTSNETTRTRAVERVLELNNMLKDLANKRKSHYSNFNLYFIDDVVTSVLKNWEAEGGQPWELIEATDGFHSNTMGQALTSKSIWEFIEANMPEVLGPINPYNKEIQKIFGDQGGY